MFGNDAFLSPGDTDGWRVNPGLFHDPQKCPNLAAPCSPGNQHVRVELQAEVNHGYFGNIFQRQVRAAITFIADTGAEITVLDAESAKKLQFLGLWGNDDVHLISVSGQAMFTKRVEIFLQLGGRMQKVPAAIPVYSSLCAWPKPGVPPSGSLLGMEGVLNRNMICLTPQAMHVFSLK